MCSSTYPSQQSLFNRCRTLLHDCLDTTGEPAASSTRADLVSQLDKKICEQQTYLTLPEDVSHFEKARSVTYQLLLENGYVCTGDAHFSEWQGRQRTLQVA